MACSSFSVHKNHANSIQAEGSGIARTCYIHYKLVIRLLNDAVTNTDI